jgi:hypothetical protein
MVIDVREDYIELATGCQLPLMSIRASELVVLRQPVLFGCNSMMSLAAIISPGFECFPFLSTIYPTCLSLHVAHLIFYSNRNIYPASNMI